MLMLVKAMNIFRSTELHLYLFYMPTLALVFCWATQ